ncbi:MAG: hypothetical protein WC732_03370 [Candidatus Omnitrophota bacterium]
MDKAIMIIHMHQRRESAPKVQETLTDFGCIIKTRLGVHDGVLDKCSDEGLILLELVGPAAQTQSLEARLQALPGVKTKTVGIPL